MKKQVRLRLGQLLLRTLILLFVTGSVSAKPDFNRIVSVDSNATEILISLGLGPHIVAADVTSRDLLEQNVANLGYHRQLNTEGVLSTHPDLIIGSDHMGPKATVEMIKQSKIPFIQLTSATTVEELNENIKRVGRDIGLENKAELLVKKVSHQAERITAKNSGNHPVMVFVLSMGGKGLSQAGTGTAADALITLLGGVNASQFASYKPISMEALLTIQPDIILIGQRSEAPIDLQLLLEKQPLLKQSKAGKNNKILSVNSSKLIAGISLGAIDEAERIADKLAELNEHE